MIVTAVRRLASAAALLSATVCAAPAQTPPHAWLFGSWTGGLFPPPSGLAAQACLAQPVVIFTRDVVLRASLTDISYAQFSIETVRTNPGVTDFRFLQPAQPAGATLFSGTPPTASGFGCPEPNALHVQRRGDNEIAFTGCADFPYPLVRCAAK